MIAPQGLVVQAQPMPGGGVHVVVSRPTQAWAPPAYAAPAHYAPMGGMGAPPSVAGEASIGAERVRYLRKVYGLLAISAFLAIGAGWLSTSELLGTDAFRLESGKSIDVPILVALILENPIIEYGTFAVLFVGVFIASLVSKVKGLNYAALFGVSILMGIELSPMIFVAQVTAGMGATMTASPVHATLSMGFWVVLAGVGVAFAIDSEPLTLAVASVGALLSIGFLLYQTSWIFRHSDMDDPVDDALGLIVQLRNPVHVPLAHLHVAALTTSAAAARLPDAIAPSM